MWISKKNFNKLSEILRTQKEELDRLQQKKPPQYTVTLSDSTQIDVVGKIHVYNEIIYFQPDDNGDETFLMKMKDFSYATIKE